MPMKINVGLAKKLGLPEYGSLGANCSVEFTLEKDLQHTEEFQRQVRYAYSACSKAINEELARQQAGEGSAGGLGNRPANRPDPEGESPPKGVNGHGRRNGSNGNGSPAGHKSPGNGYPVSEKQLNYLRQLAKQVNGLGVRRLETLAQRMYGRPLASLTSMDASGLINTLRSAKDGDIDLNALLNQEAE